MEGRRTKKPEFRVIDPETGQEIMNCFVLFPEQDRAAFRALEVYAEETSNAGIVRILKAWIERIEEGRDNPDTKPFKFVPSRGN